MREINGDRDTIVRYWECVVKQVVEQGCHLAHNVPLPTLINGEEASTIPSRRNGRLKC